MELEAQNNSLVILRSRFDYDPLDRYLGRDQGSQREKESEKDRET